MPKVFDVMAAAGRYTDNQGQEKTRWLNCGAVIQNSNGNMSLILEQFPVGLTPNEQGHGIWFSLFKPQQQNQQNQPQQNQGGFHQPQQNQNYGQPAAPQAAQQATHQPAPSNPAPQGVVPPASGNEW